MALEHMTHRAMVAHSFNPSTWEAEAGRFLSSRPAWSTKWVPGQPGLYRETLSGEKKSTHDSRLYHLSGHSCLTFLAVCGEDKMNLAMGSPLPNHSIPPGPPSQDTLWFPYRVQDHLPWVIMATIAGPSHTLISQDNLSHAWPQANLMAAIVQFRFPLPSWLWVVSIGNKN